MKKWTWGRREEERKQIDCSFLTNDYFYFVKMKHYNHWIEQTKLFVILAVLSCCIKIGLSFSLDSNNLEDELREVLCLWLRRDVCISFSLESSLDIDLLLEKCFLTRDNLWLNLDAISCADDRLVTERAWFVVDDGKKHILIMIDCNKA